MKFARQDILLIDKDQIQVKETLNPSPMVSKSKTSELKIGVRHTIPQDPFELQTYNRHSRLKLNSFETIGRAY